MFLNCNYKQRYRPKVVCDKEPVANNLNQHSTALFKARAHSFVLCLALSCKCTLLCYILEYIYMIQKAKTRTSPASAFNMQIRDQVECLAEFCMFAGNTGRVRLFAIFII